MNPAPSLPSTISCTTSGFRNTRKHHQLLMSKIQDVCINNANVHGTVSTLPYTANIHNTHNHLSGRVTVRLHMLVCVKETERMVYYVCNVHISQTKTDRSVTAFSGSQYCSSCIILALMTEEGCVQSGFECMTRSNAVSVNQKPRSAACIAMCHLRTGLQ